MLSAVRRKPTRLAADFIHALPPSALLDFEGTGVTLRSLGSCSFPLAATDCKEEEKVGVMKCGDLGLPEFSFSVGFFAEVGELRD